MRTARSVCCCITMQSSNSRRCLSFSKQIFSCINQRDITESRHVLRLAPQSPIIFVRKTSSVPEKSRTDTPAIYEKFGKDILNVYQFPYISYCNWVINLKWYIWFPIVFGTCALEETASEGNLNLESFDAYILGCSLVVLKSVLMGLPFRNFVAHIFITPEEDIVLSYLNFYGSRVDEKFPKGDLFLQSRETGLFKFITKDRFYMLIISKSTRKIFRINFRFGETFDEDLFRLTLGFIPDSAI